MKSLSCLCVAVALLLSSALQPASAEGFFEQLKDNFVRDVGRAVDKVTGKQRQQVPAQQPAVQGQRLSQPEVVRLQQGLNTLGYNVGTADGISGPATQRGIASFLRDQNRFDLHQEPSRDVLLMIETALGQPGGRVVAQQPAVRQPAAPQPAPSSVQPLGAIAVDASTGLPMVAGRPVVLSQKAAEEISNPGGKQKGLNRQLRAWHQAWGRWQQHVLLGQDPSLLDDEGAALTYAMAFVDEGEKPAFFGPDYDSRAPHRFKPDEFERHHLAERFRHERAPALIAVAPKPPFALVEVRDIQLQKYNFEQQHFPIGRGGRGADLSTQLPPVSLGTQFAGAGRNLRLATSPGALPALASVQATPAEAETLVHALAEAPGGQGRLAYLGIFSTITGIEPAVRGGYKLAAQIDRLALFADAALTRPLKTFAIDQNIAAAAGGGALASELSAIEPSSSLATLPIIAALSGQADFVESVIRHGAPYQQANEFDRDQVLADELQRVDQAKADTLWIGGSLQLGEYDRASETFQVKTQRLRIVSNSSQDYNSMVVLALRQSSQLATIPASTETARSAIERFGDRRFQVLARATPIAAGVRDSSGRPRGNLDVDLSLIYVFKKGRQDMFVLSKFEPRVAPVTAGLSVGQQSLDAAATPSGNSEIKSSVAPADPVADDFPADIVGLHLGMSFVDAEAIIQEHMSVGEVLDAKRQPLPDPNLVVPYSSGRLFVSADGMEFIQLFDEPPAATGRVAAVVRWLHKPKGSLGADAALAALSDKYGEPATVEGGARSSFSWGRYAEERRCDPGPSSGRSAAWSAGERSLASLPLPEQINVRGLPGVGFKIGSTKISDRCGPIVSARIESGRTDMLTIWLADQRGYATAIAESKKRVTDGEPADGGDSPARPSGLKL